MGKWKYIKPEAFEIRGMCVNCGTKPQKRNARKGRIGYRALCTVCVNKKYWRNYEINQMKWSKQLHRIFLKDICSRCGFIPEHKCQLDIHHIDENHHNNDPNNLMTLCANCHRLKHKAPERGPFFVF